MRALPFLVGLALALLAVPAAAPGLQGGAVHEVRIVDNAYDPPLLVLKAGDVVRWRNDGLLAHTVTGLDGWGSDILEPGATFARGFSHPVPTPYQCALHGLQYGVLEVLP